MLTRILKLTIVLVFAVSGLILMDYMVPYLSEMIPNDIFKNGPFGFALATVISDVLGFCLFGAIGYATSNFIIAYTMRFTEVMAAVLAKVPTSNILVVAMGATIGLIVANLIGSPFSRLPVIGPFIPIVLSLVLSVVGAKLALRKHNDIVEFFYRIPTRKPVKPVDETKSVLEGPLGDRLYSSNKLLDTSVIIDGRVMDIMAAGFLDGQLVVPNFVLEELQKLADSSDNMKRAKGRRGLDLVHDLQISYKGRILVVDNDYDDLEGVDAKLVRLARQANADIITNDYNLNKVAGIQGVKVLNINELANAIKPVVVAGEEMNVFLVKEGKEQGQAVAYLDDGTMIVVENGRHSIGHSAIVVVTSVLQTSAGRMIFAKTK